jgi:hypothetical protein
LQFLQASALESALAYDREMPAMLRELKLPVIAIDPEAAH